MSVGGVVEVDWQDNRGRQKIHDMVINRKERMECLIIGIVKLILMVAYPKAM